MDVRRSWVGGKGPKNGREAWLKKDFAMVDSRRSLDSFQTRLPRKDHSLQFRPANESDGDGWESARIVLMRKLMASPLAPRAPG